MGVRMMMIARRVLGIALAAAAATGLGTLAPTAASAATCRVNVVCVYETGTGWMGQYSQLTSSYQGLTRSDIDYVFNNTPNSAYISYSGGTITCVPGNSGRNLPDYGATVGIRLTSDRSCLGG